MLGSPNVVEVFVYMMASGKRGTIYIGVTSDLLSRVRQHKDHLFKNSFTDRYDVTTLVWYEAPRRSHPPAVIPAKAGTHGSLPAQTTIGARPSAVTDRHHRCRGPRRALDPGFRRDDDREIGRFFQPLSLNHPTHQANGDWTILRLLANPPRAL
jgi:hypothetical protein